MTEPIDERTLAGWLMEPTIRRAAEADATGARVLVRNAEMEEHVVHPSTRVVLRCDITLRGPRRPLLAAELKRPEVADIRHPDLIADAYSKALSRGFDFYATCNFAEAALWSCADGPTPAEPLHATPLAPGMTKSGQAPARRPEIEANWIRFLDAVEQRLREHEELDTLRRRTLPPQVESLRSAIEAVAGEAAKRLREAIARDRAFQELVIDTFSHQFGVEVSLDPKARNPQRFFDESIQVARIGTFVAATRLLMYQALRSAPQPDGTPRPLDPLDVPRHATDPEPVKAALHASLAHARKRTEDFELSLTPTVLDDIVFVPGAGHSDDVGRLWSDLVGEISRSDWTGPADYVPGLYESLLDEEHRHLMGVHYTPEPLAELIAAYAIADAKDAVIDPSCGAGTFVSLAYRRKRGLGSTHEQALREVYGVEIADFAASLSALGLSLAEPVAASAYPRVVRSDFFETAPGRPTDLTLPAVGPVSLPARFDAVIGNPPYVRFESRTPAERAAIHRVLHRHWVHRTFAFPDFTGKADLWAFFVAHAASYLREGGRLGFVLSWSLLCTNYGDAVLRFLARYFLIDAIIDSKVERFFAAKQNTVVLLARKARAPRNVRAGEWNPDIDPGHRIRFVRLKKPLDRLISRSAPKGRRAEDLVDGLLGGSDDRVQDARWDIRLVSQARLAEAVSGRAGEGDDDDERQG